MPGDVVGTRINWELRKAMLTAPDDVKHFAGTGRCMDCGYEAQLVVPAPLWAAAPPSLACTVESGTECEGLIVFVHPDDDPPDGAEPYDYMVILPEDRDR